MPINTKIHSGGLADNAVSTDKIAGDAVTTAKVADNAVTSAKLPDGGVAIADLATDTGITTNYHKVPAFADDDARNTAISSPAVGMMIYNTDKGVVQQYNAQGWASIDSPPTVSSIDYPGSATALDPAGGETLIITGTNFQSGLSVTIDNTAPSTVTRNSSTQITITGSPAKAAATYTDGLKVTNPTGLAAAINVDYSALPAWTTAAGSLGSFVDGTYTNSSGSPTAIRIVAAEGSDTIDYAQVSDATGDTVITSGVAGLTLGTTGANAGYLTGTLAGTEGTTYNFYAKPTDDEGQIGAVRLFNIISSYAATGGVITTDYSGYVVHTFLIGNNGQKFIPIIAMNIDYLIVGGGGGGGQKPGALDYATGGGGGGGFLTASSYAVTAQEYTITVGDGGARGAPGGSSIITPTTGTALTALGGGAGGGQIASGTPKAGGDGASGGGGEGESQYGAAGGTGSTGGDGGRGSWGGMTAGGGGGGASGDGEDSSTSGDGGDGGDGLVNDYRTGSDVYYAGGGGGGSGYNTTEDGVSYGEGGLGGGGDGSIDGEGTSGLDDYGGGSGGAQGLTTSTAMTGGSGIVVIRYAV